MKRLTNLTVFGLKRLGRGLITVVKGAVKGVILIPTIILVGVFTLLGGILTMGFAFALGVTLWLTTTLLSLVSGLSAKKVKLGLKDYPTRRDTKGVLTQNCSRLN